MNNVFFQTGLKNQDSLKVCLVGRFDRRNTSLSLSLSLSLFIYIYIYINENASYNAFLQNIKKVRYIFTLSGNLFQNANLN